MKTVVIVVLISTFVVTALKAFYMAHILDSFLNFMNQTFPGFWNFIMKLITNRVTIFYWDKLAIIAGLVGWGILIICLYHGGGKKK